MIRQRTLWMLALSILITAIVVMPAMSLGRSGKTVSRRLDRTHRKPLIVDGRIVGFATQMTAVFELDLRDATPFSYAMRLARPLKQRIAEVLILPSRSQL